MSRGSAGKESACNAGDLGSIRGLGRSPGEGKGYPLQYSGLKNSMDCIVHGVAKSWTQLSDFHSLTHVCPGSCFCCILKQFAFGHLHMLPGLLTSYTLGAFNALVFSTIFLLKLSCVLLLFFPFGLFFSVTYNVLNCFS